MTYENVLQKALQKNPNVGDTGLPEVFACKTLRGKI